MSPLNNTLSLQSYSNRPLVLATDIALASCGIASIYYL